MQYQFILENLNFSVNIFAALVVSWVLWLYLDAWSLRKNFKVGLSVLGFALLAASFVVQSAFVESALLTTPILAPETHLAVITYMRLVAYLSLVVSLLADPLNSHPGIIPTKSGPPGQAPKHKLTPVVVYTGGALSALVIAMVSLPILAVVVCLLYLRRATVGLEAHLRPIATVFGLLSLYELLNINVLLRATTNANLLRVVEPFGAIWVTERLILLLAVLVIGKWNFNYLLKRLQTQLYMYYSLTVLVVFVLTTGVFTGLLVRNIQGEIAKQLANNVSVLELSLDTKLSELLSDANVFATDANLKGALLDSDRPRMAALAQSFMLTKKASSLVVVDNNGQVVARGEDVERVGGALSSDPIVMRALGGEGVSSATTRDGVLAPEVSLKASWPIVEGGNVVGAVILGVLVDNAYVDGIKAATGLDTTVYGDDRISATTFVDESGIGRRVGLKEGSNKVVEAVLVKGEPYSGAVSVVNTPFFASYLPLDDFEESPVGMLFVGVPQSAVLRTAGRSIQLTFLFTGFLWIAAIVPSYLISKSIARQLER